MSASSASTALPLPMSGAAAPKVQREPGPPAARHGAGRWQDKLFEHTTQFFAVLVLLLLLAILGALTYAALPACQKFGFSFFTTNVWNPVTSDFGALAPIYGTLVTSAIALLIGVPVSFGIALFLTEMCPAALKRPLGTAVELLAAIPSIIYGMWGLFVFAPIFGDYVQPALKSMFGDLWILGPLFQGAPNGIGMLSAGFILSIMVIPFIASVMRDVFEIVPPVLKESAYGIGCTTWEVVWNIVLPYTKVGVIGGIMLGLGRALGETMAVTFVIGNAYKISASLFAPGNSIASSLANEFNEAADPIHRSSLIALGLVLFALTFVVLALFAHADRAARQGRGPEDMSGPAMTNLYRRRLFVNRFNLVASLATMAFGMAFLLWILGVLFYNGFAALSPTLFTQMTPPPGSAGGLLNAIAGSVVIVGGRDVHQHADRHPRRHLSRRVRQGRLDRAGNALHQRHPAVRAVDRDRPVRLHRLRRAGRPLLGLGRLVRARADRDPGRRADDREHAAPRAQQPARGRRRAGRADVEGHPDGDAEGGARRRHHRRSARRRAHVRRDGAAALHRAQQLVLERRTWTARWPISRW